MNAHKDQPNEIDNLTNDDSEFVIDEELGGDEASTQIQKLKAALRECNAQKKEYLDGWQRAKADLINYRRDDEKRFEAMTKFAIEDMIRDAVNVLDSFDLALKHDMPKEVVEGIILIRSQLEDILRRHGLETVTTKMGEPFDPALHEAMSEVEASGEENRVVDELQHGYKLHGRVLRPARVSISKRKTAYT